MQGNNQWQNAPADLAVGYPRSSEDEMRAGLWGCDARETEVRATTQCKHCRPVIYCLT